MRIIAGKYRSRIIRSSADQSKKNKENNDGFRPTTDRARESLFNILTNIIDLNDTSCLDLFAGSGAVGFEMLSRGAAHVDFVDNSTAQIKVIESNAAMLDCSGHVDAHRSDAAAYLDSAKGKFYDVIFADPPYDNKDDERWLGALASVKFNVFIYESGGNFGDFDPAGYEIIERRTGITNFRIYVSEN